MCRKTALFSRCVKIFMLVCLAAIFSALLAIFTMDCFEPVSEKAATSLMTLLTIGKWSTISFDDRGIPQVVYRRPRGTFYNPVYIAVYGLAYLNRWSNDWDDWYFLQYYDLQLSREPEGARVYLDRFITVADWFVENIAVRERGDVAYGVWQYDFPWTYAGAGFTLQPGWVSGMAQGLGIQVLVRAWQLTGDRRYLVAASLARNAFFIDVKDGGVTLKDSDSEWWYEEYASPEAIPTRVLNGHMHALIALWEAYQTVGDEEYLLLYLRGLSSLTKRIGEYNVEKIGWSYYDAIGTLANRKYHHINAALAKKLFEISGSSVLGRLAYKWETSMCSFFKREIVYRRPITYRTLVMIAINSMFYFLLLFILWIMYKLLHGRKHKARERTT